MFSREDELKNVVEYVLKPLGSCQDTSGSRRCFSLSIALRRHPCWGFVKPLRRCDCVPMLRDASACDVLALVTRRS